MSQQRVKYKVTNWSSYNKSLVARGNITLWISEDALKHWYEKEKSGKRGSSNTYSDFAIEACLNLRYVFKLPLRATQGFVMSLFTLLDLSLSTPDYSRLSRRGKGLKINRKRLPEKGSIDIVVDSTGLKVYGEGEWKVRQHGVGKRRTWKKLHLAVDPLDHEIVEFALTDNYVSDDQTFPSLIHPIIEEIGYCYGDGAYDRKACYDTCYHRGVTLITPPQRKAVKSADPPKASRNHAIERIAQLGGGEQARAQWKREVDYHTRSIAENAMFRFKTICGPTLKSRHQLNQLSEVAIKVNIMNQFTALGMPQSEPVG